MKRFFWRLAASAAVAERATLFCCSRDAAARFRGELLKSLQRCRVTRWKWILTFFWGIFTSWCPVERCTLSVMHAGLDLLMHSVCLCDSALKEMLLIFRDNQKKSTVCKAACLKPCVELQAQSSVCRMPDSSAVHCGKPSQS